MSNNASAAFFRAANLIVMDYPYAAAIASALRICDEACVVIGQSVDDTRDVLYALQDLYGRDRLKIREERFVFDRGWQERWWNWCREMTAADWQMYHDADEAMHEDAAPAIRALLADAHLQVIVFPYIHFYGTARYRVAGSRFYTHNARLGRASAGYRMRNWCSDAHPTHAACQMVIPRGGTDIPPALAFRRTPEGIEADAHNVHDAAAAWVDTPILHYGWCRTPQALAISQAKHRAWYANGAGLEGGHVPTVVPHDYQMAERLGSGFIVPYCGEHPAGMEPWCMAHAGGWHRLEAALR